MTAESHTITSCFCPGSSNIKEACEALISTKIESGFHLELGMEVSEYRDSFGQAIEDAVSNRRYSQGMILGLVEERIPFVRQLELLGIALHPGIYYDVLHHPLKQPYSVWLRVFTPHDSLFSNKNNYQEVISNLPDQMVPATPFESINADFTSILSKSFVVVPGGEYQMPGILTGGSTRFDVFCLDRYLGKPRISPVELGGLDYLVGVLAAYQ